MSADCGARWPLNSAPYVVDTRPWRIADPPSFDMLVVYPNLSDYENDVSPLLYANVVVATATPLPAAFPLFASGLGALGFFGWPRKRRAQRLNKQSQGNTKGRWGALSL